ncbi:MAG: hypothetical protein NC399_01690 [Muribaculum sp.]|nr:hypothetical protein [Muribaculum sp.]
MNTINFSALKSVSALLLLAMAATLLSGCGDARKIPPATQSGGQPSTSDSRTHNLPSDASSPAEPPSRIVPAGEVVSTASPEDFYAATMPAFLGNTEGENRVYSPTNVYIALAMLAEITEGGSREQLLTLLGATDIETLRKEVSTLWESNCRDDEISTILPAASLWTDKTLSLRADTGETLSEFYHATAHQGKMGSDSFNRAFQKWLNDQTGGLLQQQVSDQELTKDTLMALAATLYFKNRWAEEFSERATAEDLFWTDTEAITCDFMNQTLTTDYYQGDSFAAAALPFRDGCKMWLFLPDEDSSVEALLERGSDLAGLAMHASEQEALQSLPVCLSVPKFDAASNANLIDALQQLGITDVFDPDTADFSAALTDASEAYVSQISHAARVLIDEEGCEAAAFTTVMVGKSALPLSKETIDFTVNRPFLFVITGGGDVPLFVGVVNRP